MKDGIELTGDHFLLNIFLSEHSSPGIINLIRDPRKLDIQPDTYTGTIEEVSKECKLVKVGDVVVIERWQYGQWDYDDQRIVAREVDLLILKEEKAAPGVTAIQIVEAKKTDLVLPDGVRSLEESKFYFGRVQSTALDSVELDGAPSLGEGDFVFIQKGEYQYRRGEHTVVFRCRRDKYNQISDTVPLVMRRAAA